jgi:hypothetical protein
VVAGEPDHRQATASCGDRVECAGRFLLGLEQLCAREIPLLGRHYLGFSMPRMVPKGTPSRFRHHVDVVCYLSRAGPR